MRGLGNGAIRKYSNPISAATAARSARLMPRFGKPNATGRSTGVVTGRRGKLMKPPKGEPWCWLTRELLTSAAWRSLRINGRRFIDFLMLEHMAHAGTENGRLKATYAQLNAFGIPKVKINEAIAEVEGVGLVECKRGGQRVATTYTLTWLPIDGLTPATNKWRRFQNQKSAPTSEGRTSESAPTSEGSASPIPNDSGVESAPTSEGPSILRFPSNELPADEKSENLPTPRKSAPAADVEMKLRGA